MMNKQELEDEIDLMIQQYGYPISVLYHELDNLAIMVYNDKAIHIEYNANYIYTNKLD